MDWQRFAQAVIDRRVELGYRTRESFAHATGLSSRLLGDVERAQRDNYDRVTLARIEQALQWKPGTALKVLKRDGEEPDPFLYEMSRTADLVHLLLGPDSPLDPRTRENLHATIWSACQLAAPPGEAGQRVVEQEVRETFRETAAALERRPAAPNV